MGAKGFPKSGVARGPVQNENVGPSLGKQAEKTRERQVLIPSVPLSSACLFRPRAGHGAGALSSGLRVTPRASGPLPALVPAGVTEKHVQSWSGRMSLPGRGQPCSGHSTGCWGGEGGRCKRDPDTWEWGEQVSAQSAPCHGGEGRKWSFVVWQREMCSDQSIRAQREENGSVTAGTRPRRAVRAGVAVRALAWPR